MTEERPLPTVGPEEDGATDDDASVGSPAAQGAPEAVRVDASSVRLVATLGLAGALAGLAIVFVHQWTRPRIEAHQARVLAEAVYEVLAGPERYETAFLVGGSFTTAPPADADTADLERIYVGYDAAGRAVGVAVAGGEPGFQDVIRLIFGYDPGRALLTGMKVLESKETPGLGDKIEKDSAFVAEFDGARAPLQGVKTGRATGAETEVDMITGATISSRAVIAIINHRLEALEPPIREFWSRAVAAGPSAERAQVVAGIPNEQPGEREPRDLTGLGSGAATSAAIPAAAARRPPGGAP